jgi:hypothetical protein
MEYWSCVLALCSMGVSTRLMASVSVVLQILVVDNFG